MKKIIFMLLRIFISFGLLYFLITRLGLENILNSFSKLNNISILYFYLVFIFFLLISGLNLKILLIPLKPNLPFLKAFKYYLYIWTIRIFFPANIGELTLLYFLKQEQIELGNSSALLLIEKINSGITGLIITAFGLFIFFPPRQSIIIIAILLILTIIGLSLFLTPSGRKLFKLILGKYASLFTGFSSTFFSYLKQHLLIVVINAIFALIRWWLSAFLIYILFEGFSAKVSLTNVFLINTVTTITALIPLSLNGIGIRETSAVILYKSVNLNPATVTGTYLTSLFLGYLVAIIFLIFLFKEPIHMAISSISQKKPVPETNVPGKNGVVKQP